MARQFCIKAPLLPIHSQMSLLHQSIEMPMAYGSNHTITFTPYRDSLGQLRETVITSCIEVAVYHSGAFVIDVSYTSVSFLSVMPQRTADELLQIALAFCVFNFFKQKSSYDEFGPLLQIPWIHIRFIVLMMIDNLLKRVVGNFGKRNHI